MFGRRSTQTDLELTMHGVMQLKREQRKPLHELHAKGILAIAYLVCLKPPESQFIFSASQALMFPGQQTQF